MNIRLQVPLERGDPPWSPGRIRDMPPPVGPQGRENIPLGLGKADSLLGLHLGLGDVPPRKEIGRVGDKAPVVGGSPWGPRP